MEHHHPSYMHLKACEGFNKVPLGLRTERKFNPVELDTPPETKSLINDVPEKAECEVHVQDVLIKHYQTILLEIPQELYNAWRTKSSRHYKSNVVPQMKSPLPAPKHARLNVRRPS